MRQEKTGLYQLGVTAVVKPDTSKWQSKHHFHNCAVFSSVGEVELVVADHSQII